MAGVGVGHARLFLFFIVLMLIVATLFAPLRFYLLRGEKRRKFNYLSDCFFVIGITLLLCTGYSLVPVVVEEIRIRKTADSEMEVIRILTTEDTLKVLFSFHIITVTVIWSFKMGFMFFYASLYECTKTVKKNALYYVSFCFMPLSYAVVLLVIFLNCQPLSRAWDLQRIISTGRTCTPIHSRNVSLVYMVLTVVSDFLLLCIPLHFLGSLKLTSPEKRGVVFVFFVATISILAAVARFTIMDLRHAYDARGATTSFEKYYWAMGLAYLEIMAAEIAFVLPAMRKVVSARADSRQRMRAERARMEAMLERREVTRSRTVVAPPPLDDDADRLVEEADAEAHVGVDGGLGTFYWH